LIRTALSLALCFIGITAFGQEEPQDILDPGPPMVEGRILNMVLNTKIITPPNDIAWENTLEQETTPGHPVRLRIEGGNIRMITHFTPMMEGKDKYLLVAQGQLWIQNQTQTQFRNHFKTIPCQLGETVVFYPLGMLEDGQVKQATIAVEITINEPEVVPIAP
jgi:hypothetical protein